MKKIKYKSVLDKYKGMSFAEAGEKIGKKYPNREYDRIERQSYEAEMDQLIKRQEAMKTAETVNKFKNGGYIKKYNPGGFLTDGLLGGIPMLGSAIANQFKNRINEANSLSTPKLTSNTSSQVLGRMNEADKLLTEPLSRATPIEDTMKVSINPYEKPSTLDRVLNKGKEFGKKAADWAKNDMTAPAAIGQGLNLAINAGILSSGPNFEDPNYNPNESRIRDLMQGLSTDSTAQRNSILAAANAARANARNSARSLNTQRALDANLDNTTAEQLSRSLLQQDQMNNQYRAQEAQMEDRLGMQAARAQSMADEINARERGAFNSGVSQLGKEFSDLGMTLTQGRASARANQLMTKVLNGKYANFGVTPDLIDRMKKGNLTEDDKVVLLKVPGFNESTIKLFEKN